MKNRVVHASTQRVREDLNAILLLALGGVVRGPILRMRNAHRVDDNLRAVGVRSVMARELYGVAVLALEDRATKLVIGACAGPLGRVDDVAAAVLRLRRDEPCVGDDLLDPSLLSESQTTLLTKVLSDVIHAVYDTPKYVPVKVYLP